LFFEKKPERHSLHPNGISQQNRLLE